VVRLLIVDDHPLVRRGIVEVLAKAFPGASIAEASDGAEALQAVYDGTWDLVVLDLSLPGRTGLDVLKEIRSANSQLPVLVLSMYPESQFATRALRAGASGYLNKGSPSEVLLSAVRKVLAGGKYISASLGESLAADLDHDFSRPLHECLSNREYDVMLRIASGKTVSEIAEEIHLSVKTISTYRARILEKMRMRNNAELTQYGMREKLVEIGQGGTSGNT
jgi:two-component system, NarL family, invasion response regulator UvrY